MASGSSSVEDTKQSFLRCEICVKHITNPIKMACNHAVCCECLEKRTRTRSSKASITCPVCKVKTRSEGLTGFPAHELPNYLQEASPSKKMKLERFTATCTNCDGPVEEAEVHCIDCKEYLCHSCHTSHKKLKAMKDHKVITVEELQPRKIFSQGRYCKTHNDIARYFCKSEKKLVCPDCVSLRECHIDHDRVSLGDIKKEATNIKGLREECKSIKNIYESALKETQEVEKELKSSTNLAKTTLTNLKKEYEDEIAKNLKEHEDKIDEIYAERIKKIEKIKHDLASTLTTISEACEQGSTVDSASSDNEVIDAIASLSDVVHQLTPSRPTVADVSLANLKFEAAKPLIPSTGHINAIPSTIRDDWKLSGKLKTLGLANIRNIAIGRDGGIAVTSKTGGVKVFFRSGQVKCTFINSPKYVHDIAATPDDRYIIPGNGKLLCYSLHGRLSSTMADSIYTTKALTVDKDGRIITFTPSTIIFDEKRRMFIYDANGTEMCCFKTNDHPFRLAVTNSGDIAYCHWTDEFKQCVDLKLMEMGCNVRVIKPPPAVKIWSPQDVCCSKQRSEIYVLNTLPGIPAGIYRYTSQGNYLGCVTTNVNAPAGIALSSDERELFVTESNEQLVKIFERN